ncbi:MAG: peptidase M42 [Pleurocapsa sp.]
MNALNLTVTENVTQTKPAINGYPELDSFLNILRSLIREPSVVGCEDSFFRVLSRELEEIGVEVQYYYGVLVAQGSRPQDLILSAHIDRHGLLCTGVNEFQYAAFVSGNSSDLTGDSVSEQMMHTIENRFQGQQVQAHLPYTGTYLGQGYIVNSYICPTRNNLIFELDGLEFLQPGTPISFLDRLKVANGRISAQIDNVVSAALIIYLFRRGFSGTALFTAQEEAGKSWRYALSWFQRQQLTTQRLLVLDTSPYPTTEAAEAQQVVLRRRDANGCFAPELTAEIAQKCEQMEISYAYKDAYIEAQNKLRSKPYSLGRTELGRIATATDGQINGTTLQIPSTNYHTSDETTSLSSIEAVIRILMSYVD